MLPAKIDILGTTYKISVGSGTPAKNEIKLLSKEEDEQLAELISKIFDSVICDLELKSPFTDKDIRLIKKSVASAIVKNAHNIDWVVSSRLEKPKQNDTVPVSTTFTAIGNGIRIIKRTGI